MKLIVKLCSNTMETDTLWTLLFVLNTFPKQPKPN